jgi:hypothetical protein
MTNYIYQFPKGFESFDAVKKVIEANLPQGCKMEAVEAGSKTGFISKLQDKMTFGYDKSKMLGEIDIIKNAYVGICIMCYSSDGEKNDSMSMTEYVPNVVIRFLMNKVLGYVTNLIFPAIFGTASKVVDEIHKTIMANFEVNKLDNSVMGAIKGIGKGLGVKESSVQNED